MENIKILFVSANPTGTTTLKLDEEVREIEAKIRAAQRFRTRRSSLPSAHRFRL
jgi:hypothetical protein